MALQRLLDFGSGYEPVLQAKARRGARETTQFGVIGWDPTHPIPPSCPLRCPVQRRDRPGCRER